MRQFTGIVVKSMASPQCWEMSGRGRNLERARTCKRSKTCCEESLTGPTWSCCSDIGRSMNCFSWHQWGSMRWPVDCDLLGVQRPWVGIVQAVCAVVVDLGGHLPQLHPLHSSRHGDSKQRAIQIIIGIVILKGRVAGKLGFQSLGLSQFQRGEAGLPPSPQW